MLRVLTWNLNGKVEALQAIVGHMGGQVDPALALLTEVPDGRKLGLPGSERTLTSEPFSEWCKKTAGKVQVAVGRPSRVTPSTSNYNHCAVIYLGPGRLQAHEVPMRRVAVAVIEEVGFRLTVASVHGHSAFGGGNDVKTKNRTLARGVREWVQRLAAGGRAVIAGDFNMDPYDEGMRESDGWRADPTKPLDPDGGFANLTWSLMRWGSQGTIKKKPRGWRWFDQVLVDEHLANVARLGEARVLTELGTSNPSSVAVLSDHWPVEVPLDLDLTPKGGRNE